MTHSVVQRILLSYLERVLHPHVVRTILYDHHVENRLGMLVDVEKVFEREYGVELSIQCDVEERTVVYEIETYEISITCHWSSATEIEEAEGIEQE